MVIVVVYVARVRVTVIRKCDGPQRGVTGVTKVWQSIERCDDHKGGVKRTGELS